MDRIILIPEKELDIFEYIENNGVIISPFIRENLKAISSKKNNNYIGYYQFKEGEDYYKIYVVPKTIDIISNQNVESEFLTLVKKYYAIKYVYELEEDSNISIDGNIVDYSFESYQGLSGLQLQDFIEYKYKEALSKLALFFRKHRYKKTKSVSYSSQSINNQIDLRKNILSIDKSNTFQIKKESFLYSKIAIISQVTLNYFISNKIPHIGNPNSKQMYYQQAKSLANKINQLYPTNNTFKFSVKNIISNEITKLFKQNNELKDVYEALKILIGLEFFYDANTNAKVLKIENMTSLFFRPEKLYEWIIYDKISQTFPNVVSIKKDGLLPPGTTTSYKLFNGNIVVDKLDSKPDFIIELPNEIIIADAKWKILSGNPNFDDIAKLNRDYILNKKNNSQYNYKALLIYPKISNIDFRNPQDQFHFDFDPNFKFGVLEITTT